MTKEIFKRMTSTTLILFAVCSSALAQSQSPDRLWQALDAARIAVDVNQLSGLTAVPRNFRPFRLDRAILTNLLQRSRPALSSVSTCNGVEMTLPNPTGENLWLRFCVRESSIMEPALAAQFPTLKSYEGQGIDDPSMTARLDWTEKGLHAIVLSPTDTFLIDPLPLRRGDLSTYMSYRATDTPRKTFQCEVRSDPAAVRLTPAGDSALRIPVVSNGETLRTYRLAVAATGEYTQFHGGTVLNAISAIFTTINRVNAIYKSELAIQFVLVNDESKLIYTNPATDPYTNDSPGTLLDQNQENIDRVIGSANYDIGHVFGTGGGGLAALRVVGIDGMKARGETGSSSPRGDFFDVDYVAHEMGHQFGANHTFNGTTGNCGGNRNIDTAFEPGSGSTIMAYAGICGDENLQDHSDPFFHIASLFEILTFVNRADVRGVPRLEPTGNQAPIVQAGSQFNIPKRTPFVLTASANDPNQDALSFSWEEVDLGREAPPNNDSQDVRPIFRSFKPDNSSARFFPRLGVLLNGEDPKGEVLSSRDRILNFRVTVRDNRANGGGFGSADMRVSIVSDHGPFVVTEPAPATVWAAGSTQNVTWDVAGTSLAPINCNNVRISISFDGGKTFTVLTESTPNTGTATIVVPNTPTASARVKVEAVSNIFFNVSGGDFRIMSTTN